VNIAVDTNVLVRICVRDDPRQAQLAEQAVEQATLVVVTLPCLCEFVWVLRRVYRFDSASIASAIRALLDTEHVTLNRAAVATGLALLEAGGDFADGVLAHEGATLGGEMFVSFDKKATALLAEQGLPARLLG